MLAARARALAEEAHQPCPQHLLAQRFQAEKVRDLMLHVRTDLGGADPRQSRGAADRTEDTLSRGWVDGKEGELYI